MRTIKPVGKGVWTDFTDYSCPKAHRRCPPQSPSCKMDFRKALLCQSLPQPRPLPLVLTLRMVPASKQASATPSGGLNPARSLEADSTHPSMRRGARQLFPLACSQLPSRGLLLDRRITSVEAMYHTHTVSSAITRLT